MNHKSFFRMTLILVVFMPIIGHSQPIENASSIKIGSTSDEVLSYQEKLFDIGLYNGDMTGTFDTMFMNSVKSFQIKNGLTSDGVIGKKTQNKITDEYNKITKNSMTCSKLQDPGIKIISPIGNATYIAGQKLKARWVNCNIPQNSTVNISLIAYNDAYKNGIVIHTFKKNVPNIGTYEITIPEDLYIKNKIVSNTTIYSISVQESSSKTKYWSYSDRFKIKRTLSNTSSNTAIISDYDKFKITAPSGHKTYRHGDKISIRWEGGPKDSKIGIALIRISPHEVAEIIISNDFGLKNNGKYTWTVPNTIEPDEYYLNAGNNNDGFYAYSEGSFTIEED